MARRWPLLDNENRGKHEQRIGCREEEKKTLTIGQSPVNAVRDVWRVLRFHIRCEAKFITFGAHTSQHFRFDG